MFNFNYWPATVKIAEIVPKVRQLCICSVLSSDFVCVQAVCLNLVCFTRKVKRFEMASERILVDDLPYIDQEYADPSLRDAALALVDEETRRYRPMKNYLGHLPPLELTKFETPLMKAEFERLSQKKPMDVLSMKRYELPPPSTGRMNDLQAWIECVDNSMAQLEHQTTRILNLELMSEFGCESWKIHNHVLTQMIQHCQKQLLELRQQIQDVNWARKKEQTDVGEKMRDLEAIWFDLVAKNFEIERACAEIDRQLESLSE